MVNLKKHRDILHCTLLDLFFLLFLYLAVFLSTLGYSSETFLYKMIVFAGSIYALIRFASIPYYPKEILIALVITGLGVLALLVTGRVTLLLTAILLISSRGMPLKLILRSFLSAKIAGILILIIFSTLGLFNIETISYYKMATGTFVDRTIINGASTNVLHVSLTTIFVLWAYLAESNMRWKYYVCGIISNLIMYQITASYVGVLSMFGFLFLLFICQKSLLIRSAFLKLSILALPFAIAFSIGTGLFYDEIDWIPILDKVVQGRIYYDYLFLTNNPVNMFGHGMLTDRGNFDNSYVFILIAYGLLTFTLLFGAIFQRILSYKKSNDYLSVLVLVIYIIIGLSESFYPSAAVNPSLFLLLPLLFSYSMTEKKTLEKSTDDQASAS